MRQAEVTVALDADAFTRFIGYGLPEESTKRYNLTMEEAIDNHARSIVYRCDSFQEFMDRSGVPYHKAKAMWEIAWENYENDEARETGN